MPELERWVLHRLAELDETVREGYASFDFQGVFKAVFEFATVDLSAVYFDIRKDVLYCDAHDSPTRLATRTVLNLLFERLTTCGSLAGLLRDTPKLARRNTRH